VALLALAMLALVMPVLVMPVLVMPVLVMPVLVMPVLALLSWRYCRGASTSLHLTDYSFPACPSLFASVQ